MPPRDGGIDDGAIRIHGATHHERSARAKLESVVVLDAGEGQGHYGNMRMNRGVVRCS